MRYDEDIEIDPSFREERERAAAKAERERMIREQVVRVMSGAAAEDLAEDERLRLEQEAAEQEEREREEALRALGHIPQPNEEDDEDDEDDI